MTTYNTGNAIGSTDARDRLDNTENMDYLENSTTKLTHADRLGTVRKTRHGMEVEHDAQIAAHETQHDAQMQSFENDFDGRLAGMAFTRVRSFTTGATLTDMRQVLVWEVSQGGDGHEYGWAGTFPKVVAAGATPATSGGIGAGAWVDRTDLTLRSEINLVQRRFSTVAEMKATLTTDDIGKVVEWVYYSTQLDGGGSNGIVVASGSGVSDDGSYFNCTSGVQVKNLFKDGVTLEKFGGNLDSFVSYCLNKNITISIGDSTSITSSSYDLKNSGNGAVISGKTRDRSKISYTGGDSFLTCISDVSKTIYNTGLENIKLTGVALGTAYEQYNAVYGRYNNVWIQNFVNGIDAVRAFGNKYSNLEIWNCSGVALNFHSNNNNAINIDESNINNCGTGISLTGCYKFGISKTIIEKCTTGVVASGLNHKITITDVYAENNNTAFKVNGGSDVTIDNTLVKCEDGQYACSIVNSNTASILEVTMINSYVMNNKENCNVTVFDLTESSGTDIVRITIRDNTFRTKYSGSSITLFKSGGVSVVPDPKIIKESDIAVYSTSSPTADVGTMTVNSPLSFYPMKNGLMRLIGNVTVNTTATLTGINQCRILLPDVRFAAKYNQVFPIYSVSADPATAVAATLTIRGDGKITIASSSAITGLTFNLDEVYSRLYYPS